MRTPEETALLIALLLQRSEQKHARISLPTLRRLSKRRHIRMAFLSMVEDHLDDLGVILFELERGGYGLIPSRALEGAQIITAKQYLQNELCNGIDFDAIRDELEQHSDLEEDEEA